MTEVYGKEPVLGIHTCDYDVSWASEANNIRHPEVAVFVIWHSIKNIELNGYIVTSEKGCNLFFLLLYREDVVIGTNWKYKKKIVNSQKEGAEYYGNQTSVHINISFKLTKTSYLG